MFSSRGRLRGSDYVRGKAGRVGLVGNDVRVMKWLTAVGGPVIDIYSLQINEHSLL